MLQVTDMPSPCRTSGGGDQAPICEGKQAQEDSATKPVLQKLCWQFGCGGVLASVQRVFMCNHKVEDWHNCCMSHICLLALDKTA
jgi:hypothetical protein